MKETLELLDSEMAAHVGCQPRDLRCGRVVLLPRGDCNVLLCATSGGYVLTEEVPF